ncbi:MAG: hypothetical protein ACLU99_11070 [Alphaproteobacteria bacterium]
MRYSSLLALCAFMLCLNTPEVRGEILAVHTYDVMTHTALLPKPVASDNTFSLAATWWLPDWQGSQGSAVLMMPAAETMTETVRKTTECIRLPILMTNIPVQSITTM